MSDRELLELAAKAAGIEVRDYTLRQDGSFACLLVTPNGHWNPITDDGDAFRLVVRMKAIGLWEPPLTGKTIDGWEDDSCAATRRAIVIAAAEIGRSMK